MYFPNQWMVFSYAGWNAWNMVVDKRATDGGLIELDGNVVTSYLTSKLHHPVYIWRKLFSIVTQVLWLLWQPSRKNRMIKRKCTSKNRLKEQSATIYEWEDSWNVIDYERWLFLALTGIVKVFDVQWSAYSMIKERHFTGPPCYPHSLCISIPRFIY